MVFLFLVLMKHASVSPKIFLVETEDGERRYSTSCPSFPINNPLHIYRQFEYSVPEEGQDYSAPDFIAWRYVTF